MFVFGYQAAKKAIFEINAVFLMNMALRFRECLHLAHSFRIDISLFFELLLWS